MESAALLRGAVEIAGCIVDQSGERGPSVRAAGEAVQHSLGAGLIHFEDGAVTERSASARGAKQQVPTQDQSSQRISSILSAGEWVEHGLLAGAVQLEHDPESVNAPRVRGAIEIALRIPD